MTWCFTWHIKMNPVKSQLIYFTKRRTRVPDQLKEIQLFGIPIPVVKGAKLLGLTFTAPKFDLLQHCKNLRQKAETRINLLRSLKGTSLGANIPTLLHLYKTSISDQF